MLTEVNFPVVFGDTVYGRDQDALHGVDSAAE